MMQNMHQRRANNFHRPKKQFLGPVHAVPPAWRPSNNPNLYGEGSKILLSSLPGDVQEMDVEDLLKKTVGPLKDVFLIYNSQGKSKGMAVATFQRAGDAAVAVGKYDGKIVDGRKPLRIEVISKGEPPKPLNVAPAQPPSLMDRIGGLAKTNAAPGPPPPTGPRRPNNLPNGRLPNSVLPNLLVGQQQHQQRNTPPPRPRINIVPAPRTRVKKGAKRVQKRQPASREQLDQEMEDYRAESAGGPVALKGEVR